MKKLISILIAATFFVVAFNFLSCKRDKDEPLIVETNYPPDIENIIINKCATAGCHNALSKNGAAGLDLSTWDKMFEGSRGGACVIPYRPDFSLLIYYTNHDSILPFLQLQPTMPVNGTKLTSAELNILKNWVENGAPDKNGFVKFSGNPTRKKFYVANQGCDVISVFDAKSMLVMRMADVGNTPSIEVPHMIKVSNDNKYWFTCFVGANVFQKYSTLDNKLISEALIGGGSWNTFALSPDGKKAYVVDYAGGLVAFVDLTNMSTIIYSGLSLPHGVALNSDGDTLYVTQQNGNEIIKIDVNTYDSENINLIQSFPITTGNLQIHEIAFTPDGSKYFVTCQKSDEVRAVLTNNDSVIAAIQVPYFPQEMAFSSTHPYLFVSCMEASNPDPLKKSYVAVINYQTNTLIKNIYCGYQSHGVAVDDENNRVYVTNRNYSGGPAPHHASLCAGRNGNVTAIDMNTLELVPNFKTEVSVDPYGIGITH